MKTLFLLTCGTNACYHIAKILKENFNNDFRIIGADINNKWMIPTSPCLDVFYKSPYSSDKDYYYFILNVCKKEKVDYVFPSFDIDQQMFYDGNKELAELGVKSFGIDSSIRDLYKSKVETNRFLRENGLPTPQFYSLDELENDKHYFVKPKHGVGSVGTGIKSGLDLRSSDISELIIQEICSEPEVTLECFNYNGRLSSVARVRLDSKAGVCTKTRIYHDEKLQSIAEKFASVAKLPYIFNLQFMRNSVGNMVITDVNLRTAGGMSLSYAAGWDEISALAKIIKDLPEEEIFSSVPATIDEQYIIRAYTDIVTKRIANRIAFDLDGTLLDSRNRHVILMRDILLEYNITVDTSDLLSYKSEGHNNIEWLIKNGLSVDVAESINKLWVERIESEEYLHYDKLYSNAISVLEALVENNSLFLLTARRNEKAVREQISSLGIEKYFDEICVVKSGKFSSDLKAEFLKRNKITYMVGDTEVDYSAANIAGCAFRACTEGFRSSNYWIEKNVVKFDIKELL